MTLQRTISIRHALPLALGLLVLLTVLPVAAVSLWAVTDNTGRLLRDRQEAILDTIVEKVKAHLDPVTLQMDYTRAAVEGGGVDPAESSGFTAFMLGVLAGTPQVAGIGFLPPEGDFTRYERESRRPIREARTQAPLAPQIIARARADGQPWWGPPFFSLIRQKPTILYFQPVFRDGDLLGVFMVAVANEQVGTYLAEAGVGRAVVPFILVGRDRVMVHPNLDTVPQVRPDILRRDEVGDPVLAAMWEDVRASTGDAMQRTRSHEVQAEGAVHGFYYREVAGYGTTNWIIGFHEPRSETSRERHVVTALTVGLPLMLAMALGLAFLVGRMLSRRALAIAAQANDLEALRFNTDAGAALVDSPIREVRQTGAALSRAAAALSRFDTYVPRGLVRQLMTLGPTAGEPVARDVSVLFLDLDGYTAFSADRPAADVARGLNAIFARIGPVIEAHGGTIDKYTGDGLLAVWGVPVADPDHARHAIAAARAIAAAMAPVVRAARRTDPKACRIRIGLHCGPVIAGDLGYAGRIDYTVVGRTVNVAQRAQAALKPLADDDLVAIGVTPAFRLAAGLDAAQTRAISEAVERLLPASAA